MKYVIVDLEMNPVSNEYPNERKVSRLETIQIGAVLLDEKYQEIGSFVTLVKPEYNTRIQKRYEKLTGINARNKSRFLWVLLSFTVRRPDRR